MEQALLIPHIYIQNANALSSPYTIGFPAMTAWLGAVHALQRILNDKLEREKNNQIRFTGTGVISHNFNLQTYKGYGDFQYSIIGTSNPVDKEGNRPSFVEEARCHLEASLIIEYEGIEKLQEDDVVHYIEKILTTQMKIAGGDILNFNKPTFFKDFNQLKKRLMPGYALIERRDLMIEAMKQGKDAIAALIDYLAIHHSCEKNEQEIQKEFIWQGRRKRTADGEKTGWIIPIATGFQGISQLGHAKNQRDIETPHRFAEAIVTLGEFIMPYKKEINSMDKLIWRYHYDEENSFYLCQQKKADTLNMYEEREF